MLQQRPLTINKHMRRLVPLSPGHIFASHSVPSLNDSALLRHVRADPKNSSIQSTLSRSHSSASSSEVPAVKGKNKLGFGFSAGGLLFPYYIGVIVALRDELGVLTDSTPVAGASAGSLIAATSKSGISEADLIQATLDLARNCRKGGTRFRLRSVLLDTLEEVLPSDIHERCSNGNVHVAITKVWPKPAAKLVSQFGTRKELIETLLVSCHIPWYFDGSWFARHKDGLAFDGGLTDFIPLPPNCDTAIRVACFPSQNLMLWSPIGLSPDTFESWPFNMRQMIQWALEPADDDMLLSLVQKGKRDARAWALSQGIRPTAEIGPSSFKNLSQ